MATRGGRREVGRAALRDVERELTTKISAALDATAAPPARAELRALCATLVRALRDKTTAKGAKRIARIWQMLKRVCEKWDGVLWEVGKDTLYEAIRGAKEGLTHLGGIPSALEKCADGASYLFARLGKDRCAELFAIGLGFRHGLEIAAMCLERRDVTSVHGLGVELLQGLSLRAQEKQNCVGYLDQMRQCFLEVFVRSYPSLELKAPWEAFLVEVAFHRSLMKQWSVYLQRNDTAILLGRPTAGSLDKAPSVQAFLDGLHNCLMMWPDSVALAPVVVGSFLERICRSEMQSKLQALLPERAGFLFGAKLIDVTLAANKCSLTAFRAVAAVLSLVEKAQLYRPMLDTDFLQLQFFQRLVQVFVQSEAETPVESPKNKKRRLNHSVRDAAVGQKIQILAILLRLEARSFVPFLQKVLEFLGDNQETPEALELLTELLTASSRSRRWSMTVTALLKALMASRGLAALVTRPSVLESFGRATAMLPALEGQDLLSVVVTEVHSHKLQLWMAEPSAEATAVVSLLEQLLLFVKVEETRAYATAETLSRLMPSNADLAAARTVAGFERLLRVICSAEQKLRLCREWDPRAEQLALREPFLQYQTKGMALASESAELRHLIAEHLLHGLTSLRPALPGSTYKGESLGERIIKSLMDVMAFMNEKESADLTKKLLSTCFLPFCRFCPKDVMEIFLEGILERFQVYAESLTALFRRPEIHSLPGFHEAWTTAVCKNLARHVRSLEPAIYDVSVSKAGQKLKRTLWHALEGTSGDNSRTEVETGDCLELLEFVLRVPAFVYGVDRIRFEMCAILLSLHDEDPRLLDCIALFSVESLQEEAEKLAPYLTAVFFWMLHYTSCFSCSLPKDFIIKAEAAMYALMKQLLFSQWARKSLPFFAPACLGCSENRASKPKALTAAGVFAALATREKKIESRLRPLNLCYLSVFVHLCTTLYRMPSPMHMVCLKGAAPPQWQEIANKALKKRGVRPDYQRIPEFLRGCALPLVKEVVSHSSFLEGMPGSLSQLGTIAGIVADLCKALDWEECSSPTEIITPVLRKAQQLAAREQWKDVPHSLERVGYFLHMVCCSLQPSHGYTIPIHLMQLLLDLHIRDTEATLSLQSHTQSRSRDALLAAFAELIHRHQSPCMAEKLLCNLEQSTSLPAKHSTLQFVTVLWDKSSALLDSAELKLAGRVLERVYACFWEGYLRHVLLALVDRKKRKQVDVPTAEDRRLFSALLGSFFRLMGQCHRASGLLPQTITVCIMRRIKRIIQSLYKRTQHCCPSLCAPWFSEICDLLAAAIRSQKSPEAARALFPSLRAALETLLSLLLAWRLEIHPASSPDLDKADTALASVYGEVTSAGCFRGGLPDLLLSYLHTMDGLRTRKFTKQNPLTTLLRKNPSWKAGPLTVQVQRVHRGALTVYCALRPSELEELEARVSENSCLAEALRSFARERDRFRGYDG